MRDTKDLKATLQQDLARLATARDELRVQLELATSEAKQGWNRVERTWLQVQDELGRVAENSKEPLHDVRLAMGRLLDELKASYDRLRVQLRTWN